MYKHVWCSNPCHKLTVTNSNTLLFVTISSLNIFLVLLCQWCVTFYYFTPSQPKSVKKSQSVQISLSKEEDRAKERERSCWNFGFETLHLGPIRLAAIPILSNIFHEASSLTSRIRKKKESFFY